MGAILSPERRQQRAQVGRKGMKQTISDCFLSNGALLLKTQVLHSNGKANPIRMYSEEELKKATSNYSRVTHDDMFQGFIDGRAISVKNARQNVQVDLQQCITEIVIVSNISHRHVAKLLGCCLETPLPLLVYEHVANGNLEGHIIRDDGVERETLSWMDRLRIANEIADALNYLHSYFSTAIIHRDIKPCNILLDDHFNAKIIGFDLVLPMPADKVLVSERIITGTFGYIEPEYHITGVLNEKSDIYSFGVLLLQLLTGRKAFSENPDYSVEAFIYCEQEDQMSAILDAIVVEEGRAEQIRAFTAVAMKCINNERVKRPSMKEVTQEIRQIRRM